MKNTAFLLITCLLALPIGCTSLKTMSPSAPVNNVTPTVVATAAPTSVPTAVPTPPENYGIVSTFAGTLGVCNVKDGSASTAQFGTDIAMIIDSLGNLYCADEPDRCIRKVATDGTVTTLPFDGTYLCHPVGLALDAAGNFYVSSTGWSNIQKITPSGTITNFAGSGSRGYADGTGTAASFNQQYGIAIDNSGNLYVADLFNFMIRKVTPAGVVSTLAGSGATGFKDGPGSTAAFGAPTDVKVDKAGNVYVLDNGNNAIRKITPAGVVSTLAGCGVIGHKDGPGATATFGALEQLTLDAADNVYVTDNSNFCVRKITPAGYVTTVAGSGATGYADGKGTAASFYSLLGIAVDASNNIFVYDYGNDVIREIKQ